MGGIFGGESLADIPWWAITLIITLTFIQLLMLTLVILLANKLSRLMAKIDGISQNAGKFLQMGMTYFRRKE